MNMSRDFWELLQPTSSSWTTGTYLKLQITQSSLHIGLKWHAEVKSNKKHSLPLDIESG